MGREGRGGFTLLEVLMTLLVAGMLVGIAVPPLLGVLNASRLRDANLALAGTLRQVASVAVRENRPYRLEVLVGEDALRFGPAGGSSASVVEVPHGARVERVEWRSGEAWVAADVRAVTFDGRGRPSIPVPLRFTVRLGERERTVRLLPTGKVVVP
ncbi:GspH/FimT family pseudopilin [Deinococcus pimensis]|uniref:GspH/FimT family pseudopilin n=1 Tax=Deinococcus pimensis TaxID=309888 RepID=UPI0004B3AA5E|nr:GspH/FimT family pseudopilin [Deinococcus pimensis]